MDKIKKQKKTSNYIKIIKELKIDREILLYKSCHKMVVEPDNYKNFISKISIKDKDNKNQLNKNKNVYSSQKLSKDKFKKRKIRIRKNSSLCKEGVDNLFKTRFEDLDISFYGICDGHGDNGHLISEFIKINLPLIVYKELKSLSYLINNNSLKNEEQIKAYFSEICKQSFDIANKELISNKNINSSLSGSTCISLLFYENLIISANLGDSRAIMGKLIDNKWTYKLLSRDHNLSEIDEVLRIKYKNGEIHPYFKKNGNFSGQNRIWIKGQGIPGLAMTRSFGDIIATTIGVISEPEIKFFNYEKNIKFIIIGSDVLWEHISCQEAVNIVGEFYQDKILDSDKAVIKLFQKARNKWIEEQNCIDDITIIILALE